MASSPEVLAAGSGRFGLREPALRRPQFAHERRDQPLGNLVERLRGFRVRAVPQQHFAHGIQLLFRRLCNRHGRQVRPYSLLVLSPSIRSER